MQPLSWIAGAEIADRTVELPVRLRSRRRRCAIVPLSDVRVTLAGMARETSRIACSQSKREDARSLTVWMRVWAIASKSAYGFS